MGAENNEDPGARSEVEDAEGCLVDVEVEVDAEVKLNPVTGPRELVDKDRLLCGLVACLGGAGEKVDIADVGRSSMFFCAIIAFFCAIMASLSEALD